MRVDFKHRYSYNVAFDCQHFLLPIYSSEELCDQQLGDSLCKIGFFSFDSHSAKSLFANSVTQIHAHHTHAIICIAGHRLGPKYWIWYDKILDMV